MNNYESSAKENPTGFSSQFGNCSGRFKSGFSAYGSTHPWADRVRRKMAGHKSVNIEDSADHFVLHLFAAGLAKDQFSISVNNDVLTIGYTASSTGTTTTYSYREYTPVSFSRSFQLNGKVVTDGISATYTDGVLKVILPKNPEANQPEQKVEVK